MADRVTYKCKSACTTACVVTVNPDTFDLYDIPQKCPYSGQPEAWEIVDYSIQDSLDRAMQVPLDVDPGRKVAHVS